MFCVDLNITEVFPKTMLNLCALFFDFYLVIINLLLASLAFEPNVMALFQVLVCIKIVLLTILEPCNHSNLRFLFAVFYSDLHIILLCFESSDCLLMSVLFKQMKNKN